MNVDLVVAIEKLQYSQNEEVYKLASNIVLHYLEGEETEPSIVEVGENIQTIYNNF